MLFRIERLSALIIKARIGKGFSQTFMASQLGISQKSYSQLESGEIRMGLQRFLQIVHTTEMHPMVLINKITKGAAYWDTADTQETALSKEIVRLNDEIRFLKSENSFLKSTIDKILLKPEASLINRPPLLSFAWDKITYSTRTHVKKLK